MRINVIAGNIADQPAECIVVNLFEGVTEPGGATGAVDKALNGAIRELIASGDFRGKSGQVAVLYPRGAIPARRVLVVGLGKQEKFNLESVRQAAAHAAKRARDLGVTHIHSILHGTGAAGLNSIEAAQAIVVGTVLSLYRFVEHKTQPDPEAPPTEVTDLTLVVFNPADVSVVERGAWVGQIVAEATCLARDMVNQPANVATPSWLAEQARAIAQATGLQCQILGPEEMAQLGMGALLGVARGSEEPPRFIIVEHKADQPDLPTIVLVGKGLTFDSGGISLKPGENMHQMKGDMAGGAAVLGTLQAVAQLDLPLHVVGLVPATENLPGGRAQKPGDVVRALNGKTIEVQNTDAEGRLILADALAYASRYRPAAVVDLATLTGACKVALAHLAAGLMSPDPELAARLKAASEKTGERVWELPLWDEYREMIKSTVADMRNVGGKWGGAIAGAMLLKEFTDYPWAHLDIAGPAWWDEAGAYVCKEGTGFGVRLLVQLLQDWA